MGSWGLWNKPKNFRLRLSDSKKTLREVSETERAEIQFLESLKSALLTQNQTITSVTDTQKLPLYELLSEPKIRKIIVWSELTSNSGLGCSSWSSISRSHSQARMDWRLFQISTNSVAATSFVNWGQWNYLNWLTPDTYDKGKYNSHVIIKQVRH